MRNVSTKRRRPRVFYVVYDTTAIEFAIRFVARMDSDEKIAAVRKERKLSKSWDFCIRISVISHSHESMLVKRRKESLQSRIV